MDKKAHSVLCAINETSKDGKAVIMEKDEFLSASPGLTGAELNEILKGFVVAGYINLRYQDGDEYCVIALPKGRLIAETEVKQPSKKEDKNSASASPTSLSSIVDTSDLSIGIDYKKLFKYVFLASLAGALPAVLIGVAIIIAVLK
ncbi:MAG: hypothetical protein FWD49_02345 [Firmicutes bacterium]|nr:hypothetical protein [Bacillota bacterium]